jgi:hypothetical protein
MHMGSTRARHGVWLLGCALALASGAGCRSREAGPATQTETVAQTPAETAPGRPAALALPAFADIAADLAPLRARFQEDDGLVRVIMLVAPT